MIKASWFLFPLIVIAGCYWENEEALYPGSEICDTISVSFSEEIVPILTSNCFSCHSNLNASEFAYGITLEDYTDVVAYSSLIVGAINQLDGYPAMPKEGEKLDTCRINTFDSFLEAQLEEITEYTTATFKATRILNGHSIEGRPEAISTAFTGVIPKERIISGTGSPCSFLHHIITETLWRQTAISMICSHLVLAAG